MSRKLFAIVLGCALLAPAVASAHFAECTPGFWKNRGFDFDGPNEPLLCIDGVAQDLPRCATGKTVCCAGEWKVNGVPVTCETLEMMLNLGGACPDADFDGDPDCPRADATEFLNSCYNTDVFNPCPNETEPEM
jgi:hypothetical protein